MTKLIKLLIICLFLWLASLGTLHAQSENRDYRVLVDGTVSGSLSITYSPKSTESESIEIRSRTTCKLLLFQYTYAIHAVEIWTKGSLAAVESIVDDNGKQTHLSLETKNSRTLLQVNKTNRQSTACAATTTLVTLPDIDAHRPVHLLEIDSGDILETTWINRGFEMLEVEKKPVACTHYKVTGGLNSDLWFDDNRRLVKQTIQDSGYEITIQQIR